MANSILIVLGTISVIMMALLIWFGITIVHPFIKTSAYREALCQPISVKDAGLRTCDCSKRDGGACSSTYPCMKVTVEIRPKNVKVTHIGKITKEYNDKDKCFVKPCFQDDLNSKEEVEEEMQEYGSLTSSYQCWYNPNRTKDAIVHKASILSVIFSMVCPSAVIVICLGVFLYAQMRDSFDTKYSPGNREIW